MLWVSLDSLDPVDALLPSTDDTSGWTHTTDGGHDGRLEKYLPRIKRIKVSKWNNRIFEPIRGVTGSGGSPKLNKPLLCNIFEVAAVVETEEDVRRLSRLLAPSLTHLRVGWHIGGEDLPGGSLNVEPLLDTLKDRCRSLDSVLVDHVGLWSVDGIYSPLTPVIHTIITSPHVKVTTLSMPFFVLGNIHLPIKNHSVTYLRLSQGFHLASRKMIQNPQLRSNISFLNVRKLELKSFTFEFYPLTQIVGAAVRNIIVEHDVLSPPSSWHHFSAFILSLSHFRKLESLRLYDLSFDMDDITRCRLSLFDPLGECPDLSVFILWSCSESLDLSVLLRHWTLYTPAWPKLRVLQFIGGTIPGQAGFRIPELEHLHHIAVSFPRLRTLAVTVDATVPRRPEPRLPTVERYMKVDFGHSEIEDAEAVATWLEVACPNVKPTCKLNPTVKKDALRKWESVRQLMDQRQAGKGQSLQTLDIRIKAKLHLPRFSPDAVIPLLPFVSIPLSTINSPSRASFAPTTPSLPNMHSMGSSIAIGTPTSSSSFSSIIANLTSSRAEFSLPLQELCVHLGTLPKSPDAIIRHVACRKLKKGLKHEFLLIEVIVPGDTPISMRLERATARDAVSDFTLLSISSIFPSDDTARLARNPEKLMAGEESELRAGVHFIPPGQVTLRVLHTLLLSFSEVSTNYTLREQNCWFFCSVVLQLLCERFPHNLHGKYGHEQLGRTKRDEIRALFHERLQRL